MKKDKRGKNLQTALPKATADISNCSYKSKHFTYSCTVCNIQMGALGEFMVPANLHVVTNVQIHSVTHKCIAVVRKSNHGANSYCLV